MTSPETLKKEERVLTFGAVSDPGYFGNPDSKFYAIQPVIGYRSGIGTNQEIGMTLYGIWTPGFVFDYKHQILNRGKFYLSSDAAAFIGVGRPVGFQYDLLFGNRKLYGTAGTNYTFNNGPGNSTIILGIGKEFGEKRRIGLQATYAHSISTNATLGSEVTSFTLGLKLDLYKKSKKAK